MPLRRKTIVFSFVLLIVTLVLFLALDVVYLYLPTYIESKILPEMARKAGISEYACDMRRIDFSGLDLGPLRIGDAEKPAISIDSIQIDYTYSGLYRNEIERVALSGIELFCEYKNGKFSIRGFDLTAFLAPFQSSRKADPGSLGAPRPMGIRRLEAHNAVVVFNWEGNRLRLPVELEVVPEEQDRSTAARKDFNCTLRLYPRGQEIVFTSKLHLPEKGIHLGFEANNIHFERFSDFSALIPGLTLSGEADIKGTATFQFEPFSVPSASATSRIQRIETVYNNIRLKYSHDQAKGAHPIRIEMSGRQGKEGMITAEYKVVAPFVSVSTDSVGIQLPAVSLDGEARFERLENNYGATTTYKLSASEIKGTVQSAAIELAAITINGESEFGYPEKSPDVSANCNITADDIKILADSTTIQIPSMSLNGKAGLDISTSKGTKFASYEINASDIELTTASASIKIPGASFSGKASAEKDRPLELGGLLEIQEAGVTTLSPKTKIVGIHGIIPLRWPFEGSGKTGEYSFKGIEWKKMRLGSVNGTVRQKGSGVAFRGVHASTFLPDLALDFSGNAGVSSSQSYHADVHFELNSYQTKGDIDLGRFHPTAGGVTVSGEFGVKGDLNIDPAGPKGSLSLNVQNANVMFNEKKAAVEGIRTTLVLTDLFGIRSAPRQELYFQKASLGALSIDNGNIDFQIESERSLFIEKSRFRWCKGNVNFQAMRFSSGVDDYDLILYCDRLDLATLLKQFGGVNADGAGSVNGRLPLRINNGKVRIDDGFLFSTPGEGGAIHITGTEILTSGIPPDTVQYAQIELAREALKDYVYDWVKLNVMSEGEDLVLRLQFDGKPARALPFVYKKEVGGFAKVETSSEGSIFQGISLDVNFKVPLDRILQYKGLLDMIHKTSK
ncbi:MAG: YdbH domain-containing protein [Pseudomonadota bacterium]